MHSNMQAAGCMYLPMAETVQRPTWLLYIPVHAAHHKHSQHSTSSSRPQSRHASSRESHTSEVAPRRAPKQRDSPSCDRKRCPSFCHKHRCDLLLTALHLSCACNAVLGGKRLCTCFQCFPRYSLLVVAPTRCHSIVQQRTHSFLDCIVTEHLAAPAPDSIQPHKLPVGRGLRQGSRGWAPAASCRVSCQLPHVDLAPVGVLFHNVPDGQVAGLCGPKHREGGGVRWSCGVRSERWSSFGKKLEVMWAGVRRCTHPRCIAHTPRPSPPTPDHVGAAAAVVNPPAVAFHTTSQHMLHAVLLPQGRAAPPAAVAAAAAAALNARGYPAAYLQWCFIPQLLNRQGVWHQIVAQHCPAHTVLRDQQRGVEAVR
jgi:hypothetical protein